jgi:hypothetical protein
LAQHLPALQQDFTVSPVREPQQSSALPQQAAPALQQGWAPVQQDFTCWQHSLPWPQQPSLTAALQQAAFFSQQLSFFPQQSVTLAQQAFLTAALQQGASVVQQASFLAQQSFEAICGADWAEPAKTTAADRATTESRFESMDISTKDV